MRTTLTIFLLCIGLVSNAKESISDTLGVSFNKTIQLVFASEIKDTDVGSPDVLIQLSDDHKKLKLKAAIINFPETNLLIETEKGFYSFVIIYNEDPGQFIYKIENNIAVLNVPDKGQDKKSNTTTYNQGQNGLETEIIEGSENDFFNKTKIVLTKPREVKTVGELSKKMAFYLNGVYIDKEQLYFSVSIENMSNVDYDIDFFRFYVKDNKNAGKRTSIQEVDLYPVFEYRKEENKIVISKKVTRVFVFDKFTIDKSESFHIEVWEKNGERNLKLRLNIDNILEASPVKI